MAGRGVDIKLGGNEEHLTQLELVARGLEPGTDDWDKAWDELFPEVENRVAENREKVMHAGGLYILGTERHESRRIDNQLRGRSGRQGDPGESRFYLSAEDDLVRLFAGDRIYRILDRLGPVSEEGHEEPIEAKMLSKQIEGAQRKVEEQNFLIRKRVLEYDDVMNQQREIVYEYRDRILQGEDMSEIGRSQIADAVERLCNEYLQGDYQEDWDLEALFGQLEQIYPTSYDLEDVSDGSKPRIAGGAAAHRRDRRIQRARGGARRRADARISSASCCADHRRALARALHDMDYLREGIHLRGSRDRPAGGLKNEGFEMSGAHEPPSGTSSRATSSTSRCRSSPSSQRSSSSPLSAGTPGGATAAPKVGSTTPAVSRTGPRRDHRRRGSRGARRVAEAAELAADEVAASVPRSRPAGWTRTRNLAQRPRWCGQARSSRVPWRLAQWPRDQ